MSRVPTQRGFVANLWDFLHVRRKLWLLPVMMVLVLLGGLVFIAKGSALAPFIYAIF